MQLQLPDFDAANRRWGILSERRISQVGIAGLAISFVLLLIALLAVINGFAANTRAGALVDHTYEVKATLSNATNGLERSVAAHNGYLIDRDPQRLQLYRESVEEVRQAVEKLDTLTLENSEQRERFDRLRPLIREAIGELEQSIDLVAAGDLEFARELFSQRRNVQRLREIRRLSDELAAAEDELLEERLADERRSLRQVQSLFIAVAIALLVTALGTIWLLRRNVRSLHAGRTELRKLNVGLESAVAARTADLRRANEEIQRFAYIVSHDLRSPLVNVMGFTAELESAAGRLTEFLDKLAAEHPELVTAEADEAVRVDLPEAIEFIRTSTGRMDRLISAILDLSRQGRRVLQPETLAMDEVIESVVDSLATVAEERGAEVVVEKPLPEIHHDRIAVEQIFTNLIENALKYLRPGVPGLVRVRGRMEDGTARFEVEDNGRGIRESDYQRVFDLFRRSGEQDQPGEGIGLANVRALAYRLGGTVKVSSRFGEGSVFSVSLPKEFHDDEGSAGE